MSEIVSKECRHVLHLFKNPNNGIDDDIHLVKEIVHYDDGVSKPNIKIIKNFERPFYVTKKEYRDHFDNKEFEEISRVNRYTATQSDLIKKASKAIGLNFPAKTLKDVNNSPYIYFTDISSSVIVKKIYSNNSKKQTPYTVCGLDIETDVINGVKNIILITVIYRDEIHLAYLDSFLNSKIKYNNSDINEGINKYIGEYIDKHKYKIILTKCETEAALLISTFNKIHEWKPDWLAIWNMDFDIPKIEEACKRNNIDPVDLFSDPDIPSNLRKYQYKEGRKFKVTASGKFSPIPPSLQWHTVVSTSSFYVIDSMCSYRRIRMAKAAEPSYALDNILDKELGIRKLKFKEADAYDGLTWHVFMQKNYPLEYAVYNIFDVISMLELETKTKDLSISIPGLINNSEPFKVEFQPKLIADAFAFDILDKGYVLGTTGRKIKTEETLAEKEEKDEDDEEDADYDDLSNEDDDVLSLSKWIINLPPHLLVNNGLAVIEELPKLKTNIRGHVYDSDATSAYPSCIIVANVSKRTTFREVINIEGISEDIFRKQNMNLLAGDVNVLEYCYNMFGLPNLDELLDIYKNKE